MNVYLVVKPEIQESALASFFADEGIEYAPLNGAKPLVSFPKPAEMIVETAARICYMSFGRGRKKAADFFGNLLGKRHFSVLEHIHYGFIITGVSRSLTHELVRHRHLSFSQLSQRFVAEADAVMPPAIAALPETHEARLRFNRAMFTALSAQADMREMLDIAMPYASRKQRQEAARSVLPNATETKIFVTGNIRSWREFIEKRVSPMADSEIKNLAREIWRQLEAESSLLMSGLDTPNWEKPAE